MLELTRKLYCDESAITEFFYLFEDVLQMKDRRLVFNMDETSLSGGKQYRVLREQGHLPLVTGGEKLPHLTAAVTICASG